MVGTMTEFERELTRLLNRHSKENDSDTPDFILARYLTGCLRLFNGAVISRSGWYGRHDRAGVKETKLTEEEAQAMRDGGKSGDYR